MASRPPQEHNFEKNKPTIRDFHLDEVIGWGTFSRVYRATNINTNEVVALKCFRECMRSALHYRTAAREIAFMNILDHPNILSIKLYEIDNMFVFIGTEFAAFGSLRSFLKSYRTPLPECMILEIMKQLLAALDYMHVLGIFHGDVKPHNILCTQMTPKGPVIKMCDFGLSQVKIKGANITYKAGSFFFMAPEIHLGRYVDTACDLWSAGVVLHFMMFGRTLFNLMEKDRDKHVSFLKQYTKPVLPGIERFSEGILNLLQGLLTYDPKRRLQGKALRGHTLLKMQEPKSHDNKFLKDAKLHINLAFQRTNEKIYGEALVLGIQAVMELQIHHNLIEQDCLQRYFRMKWLEYERFAYAQERALVATADSYSDATPDGKLARLLKSTPQLLDGFNIGRSAEMFLMEGNKKKAITLFNEALRVLLPQMELEPASERKDILGKRLQNWIDDLEKLKRGDD